MNKNERLFERIYADQNHTVFSYLQRLTQSVKSAEVLTKETFIQAYGAFATYKEQCTLSVWLLSHATDRFLKFLRKEHDSLKIDLYVAEPEADILADAGYHLSKSVSTEKLSRVLSDFNDNEINAFFLHLYGEVPYEELSRLLGISRQSAEMLFVRTKERIKEELIND